MRHRDQMVGVIPRWMLDERVTIARVTAQSLAAGETEIGDTLETNEVAADVQPFPGPEMILQTFGVETRGTHVMTLEPDVSIANGDFVKVETGVEIGRHFRAVAVHPNRHHIEVLLDFLADETADDLIGSL